MSTALGIEPDISLEELLRLSVSDDWSVQFNPLLRGPGGAQGGTFIRAAAPWKGLQKMEGETMDEYLSRLEEVNEDVAGGIRQLNTMRGEVGGLSNYSGVKLIRTTEGEVYPVPGPAAAMAEHSGNAEILSSHPNANDAINALTRRTGQQPRFPTVY